MAKTRQEKERRPAREQLVKALQSRIVSGDFPPGERLPPRTALLELLEAPSPITLQRASRFR